MAFENKPFIFRCSGHATIQYVIKALKAISKKGQNLGNNGDFTYTHTHKILVYMCYLFSLVCVYSENGIHKEPTLFVTHPIFVGYTISPSQNPADKKPSRQKVHLEKSLFWRSKTIPDSDEFCR